MVDGITESRHALQEEILAAGNKLDGLFENLLSMSRIESGHLKLDIRTYPVQDIINSALKNLNARRVLHSIVFDISDDLPSVAVDFYFMERVFANILRNCFLYTAKDAVIHLHVALDGAFIRITVSDDGAGFSPEILEQPFIKFHRGTGVAPGGLGVRI